MKIGRTLQVTISGRWWYDQKPIRRMAGRFNLVLIGIVLSEMPHHKWCKPSFFTYIVKSIQ